MKAKIILSFFTASLLFATNSASAQWNLSGNAGTSPVTNFIGTTDAQPLVFRTSNTEAMRMLTNGNIGIGNTTFNIFYIGRISV